MTVGLSVATMYGNVQNFVWLPWQPFKSRNLISWGLFVMTTQRNTKLLVHNHRPYSRQVTEWMECDVAIHPPPSMYPKAGNGALRGQWAIKYHCNKANLRDLIAATGLVILLKLDLNRRFFSPCDLDIWWMTPKNNGAPLLCYFKLFASFHSHWWIQTGVTVRKSLIWVKIDTFFSRVTLKFDGWPSKKIGHLFYVTSSFVQHFVAIDEFKLELQSGNA